MRRYKYEHVVEVLRKAVAKSTQAETAAGLGVTPELISMILQGKRQVSSDVAFRLGFIKLPDTYMRTPKHQLRKQQLANMERK